MSATVATQVAGKRFIRADAEDAAGHEHGSDGKFTSGGGGAAQPRLPTTSKALHKVGSQLGSNPGGQYKDIRGHKFYVKQSKSPAHAANEVLAGHLYNAVGSPIAQAHSLDKGASTISRWQEHDKPGFNPNNEGHRKQAQEHFATHAWLGNWDAIGLENDNQVPIGGKLHTIDAGGSMKFRAMGAPKAAHLWGPEVHELMTMRDPDISPQAANVFGAMSPEDLHASAQKIKDLPMEKLHALVHEHGHGTHEEKNALVDLLAARRTDLLKKTGHL